MMSDQSESDKYPTLAAIGKNNRSNDDDDPSS